MVVEQGEVLNRIDENVESAKVDTHDGVEKLEEVDEEKLNVIRNNHFVILGINFAKSSQTKENDYWDCAFNHLDHSHSCHCI